MNISAKCNCCVCEPVCRYKEVYENAKEAIFNAIVNNPDGKGFWHLKDCPHVEVSIKCPHMITRGEVKNK